MDLALLSLELAAALAQPMRSGAVRAMLDHSLPQYLDALYRVANLLCLRGFPPAGQLIGAKSRKKRPFGKKARCCSWLLRRNMGGSTCFPPPRDRRTR